MAHVKAKRDNLYVLFPIFLLALSTFSVIKGLVGIIMLITIGMFLFVKLMPKCKYCENLWMFFLTAVVSGPINIHAVFFIQSEYLEDQIIIYKIPICILLFIILLSAEEITIGTITRFFWRKQYKLQSNK